MKYVVAVLVSFVCSFISPLVIAYNIPYAVAVLLLFTISLLLLTACFVGETIFNQIRKHKTHTTHT